MAEKIQVSEIIEKLQNGETLDHCGIEVVPYLPIATKKQIIDQIVLNSIIEVDGMKVLDPINKYIALNVSMITFYSNIDGDFDDMCEYGIIEYVKDKIKNEYYFICDMLGDTIQTEIETHNSLVGMLNRNITTLVAKIPTEDAIKSLVTELPNIIKNVNPDTLKFLAQAIGWNNGVQPNREQRRKTAKSDKTSKAKSTENVIPISE